MPKKYTHLTVQERAIISTIRVDLCSLRSIAKRLCRCPGTISCKLERTGGLAIYDANLAHLQSQSRRTAARRTPKLQPDSPLFDVVRQHLNLLWSPPQIASKLKAMWPDDSSKRVSHETVYNAIYASQR